MKTLIENTKSSNNTYNPALDHLIGKEIGKKKVDAARAFLKEHGLPKRFYEKDNS